MLCFFGMTDGAIPLHWNGQPASAEALEIHDNLAHAFASLAGANVFNSRQSAHYVLDGVIVFDFTSDLIRANSGTTEIETPSQVQAAFQGQQDELFAHVLFSPGDPLELTMEDTHRMAILCDELLKRDMDDVSKEFLRILSGIALELSVVQGSIDTKPYEQRMREIFPSIFSIMYHDAQLTYTSHEHQIEMSDGGILFVATNKVSLAQDEPHEDLEIPPFLEVMRSDGETSWTYTRERDGSAMTHIDYDDTVLDRDPEEAKAL